MKNLAKAKKAQVLSGLQAAILSFVVIAMVLGVGLYVLQEFQYSTTTTGTSTGSPTNASIAIGSVIVKMGTVPTWLGILIIVIFAAAVITYIAVFR